MNAIHLLVERAAAGSFSRQEEIGWSLVLLGLLSGSALGLAFHRADFLGGYASLQRRLVRLGHIALVALGVLNLEYASSSFAARGTETAELAGLAFAAGGVLMPAACFLAAWRPALRPFFAAPVALLVAGASAALAGGAR